MIVIFQRSLCFFICNRMGRLNLLNPQHGTLCTCEHTHTHTKTQSGLAETGFLGHTRTHTQAQKSMKWCSRQTWWRLIPTKPLLSSAECQLSRESTRGPVAPLRVVGGSLTHPPRTHKNIHLPLPACCSDWQKLKLFHAFYPLGGISRPKCRLHTECHGETAGVILG